MSLTRLGARPHAYVACNRQADALLSRLENWCCAGFPCLLIQELINMAPTFGEFLLAIPHALQVHETTMPACSAGSTCGMQ